MLNLAVCCYLSDFRNWPHATALSDKRIQKIPFAYNIVSILPDSQQIELEFPMFIQGKIFIDFAVHMLIICW